MSRIMKFNESLNLHRIFESDDNTEINHDDVVERGHKYSWNEIKEKMLYLTDVGFKYVDESKSQYFIDNDRNRSKLSEATLSVIEFSMQKPVNPDLVNNKMDIIHYTKWDDSILEMWEAIASFCAHFEDCYFHLSIGQYLSKYFWNARFIIYSPIEEEVRNFEIKSDNAEKNIYNQIFKFKNKIMDVVTTEFRNGAFKNLLGNQIYGYIGDEVYGFVGNIKTGFLILPLNLTKLPKGVIDTNISKINKIIDRFDYYFPFDGNKSCEFREITIDDLKKLSSLAAPGTNYKDIKYLTERYLGLTGIIINFDYEKWFNGELNRK